MGLKSIYRKTNWSVEWTAFHMEVPLWNTVSYADWTFVPKALRQ